MITPFRTPDRRQHEDAALMALQSPFVRRLTVYAFLLAAFYLVRLISLIGSPDGFIVDDKGLTRLNDFAGVYTAGQAANEGVPQAAYDWTQQKKAQGALRGEEVRDYYPWPYPPTFLPVASLLACLPFGPSLVLWMSLTFALFAFSAALVLGNWRGAVFAAACPVTLAMTYTGQNGFLSAALLGLALVALPARPVLAGILFGMMAYKPHLGLMIPIALLVDRQWPALLSAALTVIGLAVTSLIIYGADTWRVFFEHLSAIAGEASQSYMTVKLQSLYGLAAQLGLSHQAALTLHILAIAPLAAVLALIWRRDVPYVLKASMLATMTVMASPYLFLYDMPVLILAQLFLVRHLVTKGLDPIDAAVLIAVNVSLALFPSISCPAGALAALAILGLALRHAGFLGVRSGNSKSLIAQA